MDPPSEWPAIAHASISGWAARTRSPASMSNTARLNGIGGMTTRYPCAAIAWAAGP
jgi:hypothetical protein